MAGLFSFTAAPSDGGKRVDAALAAVCPELSRSAAARCCDAGRVTVNGRPARKRDALRPGDAVTADIPPPAVYDACPQDIPLRIVYEDDALCVVDKPRGMVVHPAPGHADGTLANALMNHCGGRLSGEGGPFRPGIVHRIDRDTSGLLAVAKTDRAHRALAAQLADHSMARVYRAIALGRLKADAFTVDASIARHPTDRKRMAAVPAHMPEGRAGRRAVTHVTVLERFAALTYIEARLETGRTHQIRVHLAHIGHPLLGDAVYGPKKQPLGAQGQYLHAGRLSFSHPVTGEAMTFEAPLPEYFTAALDKLRRGAQG